jgi:hypothetical protein
MQPPIIQDTTWKREVEQFTSSFGTPHQVDTHNNETHELNEDITEEDINIHIKHSNSYKSPGTDNIYMMQLQHLPQAAIKKLSDIYNAILKTGHFPQHFKTARIIMLPKVGKNKSDTKNYRPISLTNTLGKIIEKIIKYRLQNHLEDNNFFSNSQHGFRAGKSTTDQLVKFIQHIYDGFNTRSTKRTVAILLDVEKAFDTVWHQGLIYKIAQTQIIPNTYTNLISNYLKNRQLLVQIKGQNSNTFTPLAGVPQGAILSPLIFNIYVNDMNNIINRPYQHIHQFADDTCLFTQHISTERANNYAQELVNNMVDWCKKWGIKINPNKTQLILFQPTPKRKQLEKIHIQINGTNIQHTPTVKLLGLTLQRSGKLYHNCLLTKKKITQKLNSFKYLAGTRKHLTQKQIINLYKAVVRPNIEYIAPLHSLYSTRQIHMFQQTQNVALRLAAGAHRYISNDIILESTYEHVKILQIKDRLKLLTMNYINKTDDPDILDIIEQQRQKTNERYKSPLFLALH